jgi:hypothetical protein
MSEPTDDGLLLLRTLARFHQGANWYKLGRITLGAISSPGHFTEALRALIVDGYVAETRVEGEELPELTLTEKGRMAIGNLR